MPALRVRAAVVAALASAASLLTVSALGPVAPAEAALISRVFFNDPDDHNGGNNIRYLFHDRFATAPAGSTARVVMFNIDDTYVMDAMIAAKNRGVNVKVIVANSRCDNVARLRSAFGTNRNNASWVHCSIGSSRSEGGNMHQKSVTFSSTDGTPYVTLVGSANMTEESWKDQWNDTFQYANRKDIYDAYNEVFALQKDDVNMPSPYRTFTMADGIARANFTPVDDETPDSTDDPVLTRLKGLPSNSNTSITVATYAMHGPRGTWLTDALIAKKNAGAKVGVISGPPTSDALEDRLRAAGIPVTRAFGDLCDGSDHVDRDCNYTHLKAMTAKYYEAGAWEYRTYTGSDNWADEGLNNDEVTQRIGGERIYSAYEDFFNIIKARY